MWVSDLAWRQSGGWVVPDPGSGQIYLYTPLGEHEGTLTRPGQGSNDLRKPSAVQAVEEALLLVNNGSGHWLWLDEETLQVVRHIDLASTLTSSNEMIASTFQLAATGDNRLFTSIHVYQPDDTWWTGLGVITLTNPPRFHRILEIDPQSPEAMFYTMSLQTVATAGGSGYFLQFEEPVHLLEDPGKRRLKNSIPKHLQQRPNLPDLRPETLGLVYKVLERTPLAAGLYGHGDRLFLLERRPLEDGARWRLHEIDPAADRITRSLDLPTRAHWIELAAGPDHWAILEKGSVQSLLNQVHHGLMLVPTSWIEADRSPLAAPSEVECRKLEPGESPPPRSGDSPEVRPTPN